MNGDNSDNMNTDKVPFEAALDKVGFGLYSYLLTALTGFMIISFACVTYSSMFIVPTSACELETTPTQQGLLAAGPVVGLLTGVVWGYLADTRGRRFMLLVSLACSTVFNLIATISVNWVMLLILQFFAAVSSSGLYSMVMTLASESVPMAKRNIVVLIVSSIFLLAQGLMAVIAIPIIPLTFSFYMPSLDIYWNSWRTLLAVYCIPNVISIVCLYFMQESPKFVFVKGDEARALEILKTIHRINNRGSKEEFQIKGLLKDEISVTTGRVSVKEQIAPLFKTPLLKFTILMSILFFTQQISAFLVWLPTIADRLMRALQVNGASNLNMCDVLFFGVAPVNIPRTPDAAPCSLNETSLLFILGAGALQSIVNLFNSFMVNKVGRRNLVIVILLVCGISGNLVILVPNAIGSMIFFVIMITGFVVYGLYTAICVALFPTNQRAMALALTTTFGRIGTIASIQILNAMLVNGACIAFNLFATLFGLSVIAAAMLPNDRRRSPAFKPAPSQIENAAANNENTS